MKIAAALLALAALVAVVAVGLSQRESAAVDAGGITAPPEPRVVPLAEQRAAVADTSGPLRDVYARANELIGGGKEAFEAQLDALEGRPVVVNKWASWCGPCRAEFPFFQEAVTRYGDRVAFLGLNSGDNEDDARRFLEEFPVAYPSFSDPDEKLARTIGAPANYPITVFFDGRGDTFVHQGGYATAAQLAEDIERYAVKG